MTNQFDSGQQESATWTLTIPEQKVDIASKVWGEFRFFFFVGRGGLKFEGPGSS